MLRNLDHRGRRNHPAAHELALLVEATALPAASPVSGPLLEGDPPVVVQATLGLEGQGGGRPRTLSSSSVRVLRSLRAMPKVIAPPTLLQRTRRGINSFSLSYIDSLERYITKLRRR